VPKKILLVEDNLKNRAIMRDILVFHEYSVREAENGEQAVEAARAEKPDLVLMDIRMPVMDGCQAIKLLRTDERTRDVKIIAVTSYAMESDRERILASGADAYVSKPFELPALVELVKKLLAYAPKPA